MTTDTSLSESLDADTLSRPAELPEAIRIPLHSLSADIGYLFGRVAADGSCAGSMAAEVTRRLNQLESALDAQALRIAELEAQLPKFEGVAKSKLDDLVDRGWVISGYAITKDGEHGLVTTGAFVGWWSVVEQHCLSLETQNASQAKMLEVATQVLKPFVDAYRRHDDPGISDLYAEQPMAWHVPLGAWRGAAALLSKLEHLP